MATVKEIILDVQVKEGNGQLTVKGLRQEISDLRDALLNADQSSDEYKEGVEQLAKAQGQLNSVMKISSTSSKDLKGSYNALQAEMTALRKEWKATNDVGKREELGKRINSLNDQLKDLDASVGNHQRNVGNYQSALAGLPGPLGKFTSGLKSATMQAKAFIATPIGAILTAVSAALAAVIKGFKSSEENMNSLTLAMAPFKAAGDFVTNMCQGLAKAIGKVAEGLTKWLERTGRMTEKMKENQAITKLEIEQRQEQRRILIENAKLEMEVAQDRQAAADKANHSVQERIALLKDAAAKEKQIADNNLALAQRDFDIAKRKAALTGNDIATNDELAQKEAALYNARAQYAQSTLRITSQLSAALMEFRSQDKAAIAEIRELITINDEWLEKTDKGIQARLEAEKAASEEEKALQAELSAFIVEANKEADDAVAAVFEEQKRRLEQQKKDMQAYASATASVLNNVASAWNSLLQAQVNEGRISQKEAQKQFQFIKGLQMGQAVINTAAGAVSALAAPDDVTMVQKWAQFAAVLTAGAAQIATIASASMSGGGTAATAALTGASGTAPSINYQIPTMSLLTGASDEALLNRMASDQRVYLVYDDVAKAGNKVQVRDSETNLG